MHVTILDAAVEEAEDAAAWYESHRRGLGSEFRNALGTVFARLRDLPTIGRPWPGKLGARGVRRLMLPRFPFFVIFSAHDERVVVLAVAHHRRRPGYWRTRLSPPINT